MKVRRAPLAWMKEDGRVLILSEKGVFLLNRAASEIWESLEGEEVGEREKPFIELLLQRGLVEPEDD